MAKKNKSNNSVIIVVLILAAIGAYLYIGGNQGSQLSGQNDASTGITTDEDLKILKSEVSEEAKFYPYKAGDIYMEVLAVKATDGSIRTALNTCQVCFTSGRGYYKQQGNRLICQNCGNAFRVDDVEVVRGGCNPVPVLPENKTDEGEYITIKKEFLEKNKVLFENWKS